MTDTCLPSLWKRRWPEPAPDRVVVNGGAFAVGIPRAGSRLWQSTRPCHEVTSRNAPEHDHWRRAWLDQPCIPEGYSGRGGRIAAAWHFRPVVLNSGHRRIPPDVLVGGRILKPGRRFPAPTGSAAGSFQVEGRVEGVTIA